MGWGGRTYLSALWPHPSLREVGAGAHHWTLQAGVEAEALEKLLLTGLLLLKPVRWSVIWKLQLSPSLYFWSQCFISAIESN